MAQTLEQRIRRVIKEHYGENLWAFRDDVNYKEGTKAFVAAVALAIKGKIEFASDLQDEVAKYSKGGGADRVIGGVVRKLRLKRDMTLEGVAAKVGYCVAFLDAMERGRLTLPAYMYMDAYYAMKPTRKEIELIGEAISERFAPESMIQDVIETYYGMSLWAFKPDVSYEEAIAPFIRDLAALAKPMQLVA